MEGEHSGKACDPQNSGLAAPSQYIVFCRLRRQTHFRREQVFLSLEWKGRAGGGGGAEWGVKKSISDDGGRWKERKVTPEYRRTRVPSRAAALRR